MSDHDWKEEIIKERLGGKKNWTDSERMQLSHDLDKEINDRFDKMVGEGKGKNKVKDAWTEENWKEKMAEHPIFSGVMGQNEEGKEIVAPDNALTDGLAQLKFSPDHNTPLELAQRYKEDGVHHFKYRKYNQAIANFTEGLNQPFQDVELRAQLFNNRAAAHSRIANYRQAIRDCESCITLKPDYRKAIQRAAESADSLGQWEELARWADRGLALNPEDEVFVGLRLAAIQEQNKSEKITRKKQMDENQKFLQMKSLISTINEHGVKLQNNGKTLADLDLEDISPIEKQIAMLPNLEPEHSTAKGSKVHLNKSGELVWPILLVYPEYQQTDFIQHFNEKHSFVAQLEVVFGENAPPAPWDRSRSYTLGRIQIYFEHAQGLVKIPLHAELKEILADERYVVKCGTPSFIVCAAESKFLSHFLSRYKTVEEIE